MPRIIDFYWDIGSTNTYFALHLIRPVAKRHNARLVLHPFNLGYVFRHHQYVLSEEPASKLRNRRRDLERWAEKYRLPFRMPERFPIKTSHALRGAIAMRDWDLEMAYVDLIFRCYWERNDASVAEPEGLARIVEELGVEAAQFLERIDSATVREALISSTNSGLEKGVFGAPSFVIDGELFWGKDRMEFIEDALARS
ncbi:MAG: 2-hydroxychromene-2-carboxylate isomerase [Gammaproteobacteria bacterium]|nr:2-hydroxychromene-2-carboxylate isomerase [Gammaproteobacteria bacterium]MCZ6855252.1 2-hydroxychromene-2-carboxylate isomerase [Gammaproteobacteria bacterium]